MKKAILDTNLYVGWLNEGRHAELMLGSDLARFLSTVVLMELRVGADSRAARGALDRLLRAYTAGGRVSAPSVAVFDAAGVVLRALRRRGREIRRASLAHDVLIALSARAIGATVYTRDGADFEAIRAVRDFSLVVVP